MDVATRHTGGGRGRGAGRAPRRRIGATLAAVALVAATQPACMRWRSGDTTDLRAPGERARVTLRSGERVGLEVHGVQRRVTGPPGWSPGWSPDGPGRPRTTTDILGRDLRTSVLVRIDVRDVDRIEVRRANDAGTAFVVLGSVLGAAAVVGLGLLFASWADGVFRL